MKILFVNKFLYLCGGSETYIFKLGDYLKSQGHEIQYFGMQDSRNIVGNNVNAYTKNMDFHGNNSFSKIIYPIKTIYSMEARRKIRKVLDVFQPDVVHLNNFTYQITPSVILEIIKWERQTKHKCRIVLTTHDSQLVCPNHMLYNPNTHELCEKCLGGHFGNCVRGKCIHGSFAKSVIGALEGYFWNLKGTYKYIDSVICPSSFNKKKMDTNPYLSGKTVVLRNFIEKAEHKEVLKKRYVLYFGRYSEEKGIYTLLDAVRMLPDIPFVFAGSGPLEDKVDEFSNIHNVGFKTGEELDSLIREAKFSICPSEVHENCPFSVMESEIRGTPVIGAKVGGIPELIEDGENGRLFEQKNRLELTKIIRELWENSRTVEKYSKTCLKLNRDGLTEYYDKLIKVYEGKV